MPLERHLQASVLKHMKKLHLEDSSFLYRKKIGVAFGLAGDPDLYGAWAGVPWAIELKRPGESPTLLQRARLAEWERAGAVTGVVHSILELQDLLAKIRQARP